MLILERKVGERIFIGNDIRITVLRFHHGKVAIGFDAPEEIEVNREEVYWQKQEAKEGDNPE